MFSLRPFALPYSQIQPATINEISSTSGETDDEESDSDEPGSTSNQGEMSKNEKNDFALPSKALPSIDDLTARFEKTMKDIDALSATYSEESARMKIMLENIESLERFTYWCFYSFQIIFNHKLKINQKRIIINFKGLEK